MFSYIFKKIFGSSNDRFLKSLRKTIATINSLEPEMQKMQDVELATRIAELKELVQTEKQTLDDVLPETFAIVREASVRTLKMRHYDVQLIGGITLHKGKIAEMKTGEGKTLVATLPVVLNALSGKGVHVVTVNDYLAMRDAEWMGQIYKFLGLSVGVIVHNLNDEERKIAYAADITYGTNNEFGFDYLRDNMKFSIDDLVQRGHNFAIVDEVDSILIDEARTPLIISGAAEDSTEMYARIDKLVQKLQRDIDFTVDEKARTCALTEQGSSLVEKLLGLSNLYDPANITLQHHVLQGLKAHNVFRKDVDYIVKDDQVVLIDEFTGRTMEGRRFSDGLHQALEAKEHVTVAAESQTLASITFQNYFRMYDKLAGMTGTADTEAVEFNQIYNLEVISIPPNKPMIRKDLPDFVFRTKQEKFNAIVLAITELYKRRQPVLVGTISIETSELISSMLKRVGIPHSVLNAKYHAKEAEIVAQAGQAGKVTIATNMAGRGTDIVLGEGVTELGGLFILGTERHESRRIDNQLRGRSGRQGDPGASRFFLSLEDDLMRLFGSDRLSNLMQKLGMPEGEPIENKMVSRAIETAQKRVEGHHFEIRKTLLDFDNVMNQQREVIYELRHDLMQVVDIEGILTEYMDDLLDAAYERIDSSDANPTQDDYDSVIAYLRDVFNLGLETLPPKDDVRHVILAILSNLKENCGPMYLDLLRYFLLEELDRCWKEHLRNMDALRDGIGLRGYGQRDPKLEYKREGYEMFQNLLLQIREGAFRTFTRIRVQHEINGTTAIGIPQSMEPMDDEYPSEEEYDEHMLESEQNSSQNEHEINDEKNQINVDLNMDLTHHVDMGIPNYVDDTSIDNAPATASAKIGRNDLCPCGSGKKYKKCCGAKKA